MFFYDGASRIHTNSLARPVDAITVLLEHSLS